MKRIERQITDLRKTVPGELFQVMPVPKPEGLTLQVRRQIIPSTEELARSQLRYL